MAREVVTGYCWPQSVAGGDQVAAVAGQLADEQLEGDTVGGGALGQVRGGHGQLVAVGQQLGWRAERHVARR